MINYPSSVRIKIDWADLDLFGHVNNVAFFRYMQASRLAYGEKVGLTSLNEKGKLSFMVASSRCQFKKPLKYPGEITVYTTCDWIKNSSFQVSHTIINDEGETAGTGTDVLVLYDHHHKTKVNISENLRRAFETLEGRIISGDSSDNS